MNAFRKHKIAWILAATAILLVLTVTALPWKAMLEKRLIAFLEERGFGPIQMTVSEAGRKTITLDNIAFKSNNMDITVGKANINGPLNGQWEMKDIKIAKSAFPIPVLSGSGTISTKPGYMTINGKFFDIDNTTLLSFVYDYNFWGRPNLTITEFKMPWNEGSLSAKDVFIPIGNKAPLDMNLQIKQVSADALMQQFTGNRASATGKISGMLPLTITVDNQIIFHEGQMQSEAPGTIKVSPEVIPGDNEQVTLVRDVLQDFRYNSLIFKLNSDKDNHVDLIMKIEGNNPSVQQGRTVKMNVNLKGDVLGFVQQSLLWLTNPMKIMEQGKNAKP